MIVWLASYPRSGNTLTRTLLHQVFGLETYSEYNDLYDLGSRPDVAASVGHRTYEGRWQDVCADLAADADLHIVKTHGPPQDTRPAIYVVRDARAAIVSQRHFFHNRPLAPTPYTMRQLVDGAAIGGDWSTHLDAWSPLQRPRTLLLRYEDLVAAPERVIALLAGFLDREPQGAWQNPFERQRTLLPSFFRCGSDAANLAEWTDSDLAHFWERHGRWMQALGYGTDATPPATRPPAVGDEPRWENGRLALGPEARPGITMDGVFPCEIHQGAPCRWSTDRMRLTLALPAGSSPAALEIALWGYGPETSPVTIRANGATVFEGPRSALVAARLPLTDMPPRADRLDLEIDTVPFSTEQDSRALGLCIRDLALTCAEAPEKPTGTEDRPQSAAMANPPAGLDDLPAFILVSSYPRSGNNWVCHLIEFTSKLSAGKRAEDHVKTRLFDVDHLLYTGELETINSCSAKIAVLKTHFIPEKFSEIFPNLAKKIILHVNIIRSPLNVIPSLFNFLDSHSAVMTEKELDDPSDRKASFQTFKDEFIRNGGYFPFVEAGYGTWEDNVSNWSRQGNFTAPTLSVRYKDLVEDPKLCLSAINETGSLGWTRSSIDEAVAVVTKDHMKAIYGDRFILRGHDGYYEDYLSEQEIASANTRFGRAMTRFGL